MGMDVPSVAVIACLERTMAAHNELLAGAGRRFLIVEEMDLDHDLAGLVEVRIQPWLVRGHGQRAVFDRGGAGGERT